MRLGQWGIKSTFQLSKNSQQHVSRQSFVKWIIIQKIHLKLKYRWNVEPGKLKFLLNIAYH